MSNNKVDYFTEQNPSADRRAQERITSLYRPVLIELDGFWAFCLVKNLSSDGMMGTVYAHLAEQQTALVHFNSHYIVPGKVIWSKDGNIGIKFDDPIDVEETIRQLSAKYIGEKVNRSPRIQIECDGKLEFGGNFLQVKIRDISQRGLKVEVGPFRPVDEVTIHLEGMEPHKALVRWVQNGLAGLNFISPISFEQLANWVIGCQSSQNSFSG